MIAETPGEALEVMRPVAEYERLAFLARQYSSSSASAKGSGTGSSMPLFGRATKPRGTEWLK